jgi:hypothetical protein
VKLFEPKASYFRGTLAAPLLAKRARQNGRMPRVISMAFFAIDGDVGCPFSLLTFFLGMQKES